MKRFLLTIFAIALCGVLTTIEAQENRQRTSDGSKAQISFLNKAKVPNILFEDDFGSGDLSKWDFIQGDGVAGEAGNIPYFNVVNEEDVPEYSIYGDYLLQSDWGYDINTWIISPEITIDDNTLLSFFYNSSYYWHVTEDGGSLYVKVSEDGGNTWDIIWDWQQIGEWESWTWYGVLLDLSAYDGKDVHIAFNLEANDNAAASLDMIQVYSGDPISHDSEMASFSFEEDVILDVDFDGTDVTVTVAKGTDVTALTPVIDVSSGATVHDFDPSVALDFTDPVEFIVISESGFLGTLYTVTVVEGFEVIFNVNMEYASGFDPDNDVVYITGSFLDWAEPGDDPDNQTMIRIDDTWVWTKTLELAEGVYEYKYFINAGLDGGEWDGDDNRTIEVSEDMEVNNTFGWPTSVEPARMIDLNTYPNPFNNYIEVTNTENISRVVITNLIGQVVVDEPMTQNRINTSELSNGVYLIVFQTNNGDRIVKKMIKQ